MLGYAFALLVVLILIFGGLCVIVTRQNRTLRKELAETKERVNQAINQVDSAIDLHNQQQEIREEAETEKQELEQTNNSDLGGRANNLFK